MIRKNARFVAAALLASALAACGKVGDLEPRTGQSLPPKAYGQKATPSAESLSTPSVQARPGRSDELLRRSERREDDPFDLAPGEEPVPLPDPDADKKSKPKAG
jgi:predicted small lipoprotein YifL